MSKSDQTCPKWIKLVQIGSNFTTLLILGSNAKNPGCSPAAQWLQTSKNIQKPPHSTHFLFQFGSPPHSTCALNHEVLSGVWRLFQATSTLHSGTSTLHFWSMEVVSSNLHTPLSVLHTPLN